MSVDKFGHYLNDTSGIISTKNAPKLLGFFMDTNNNIDVQNKRIKNVAKALEENDAINKLFLQTQIEKLEHEITLELEETNNKINAKLLNIKLQLEENNNKINEKVVNIKSFFEEQLEQLNEKIYRFEKYMFVSIAESASNRAHSIQNKPK